MCVSHHNKSQNCGHYFTGMMLKENNTVKKLDLEGCELQPEGLEEVIKGVQVNTKLEPWTCQTTLLTTREHHALVRMTSYCRMWNRMYICLYERALHWYVSTGLELW